MIFLMPCSSLSSLFNEVCIYQDFKNMYGCGHGQYQGHMLEKNFLLLCDNVFATWSKVT